MQLILDLFSLMVSFFPIILLINFPAWWFVLIFIIIGLAINVFFSNRMPIIPIVYQTVFWVVGLIQLFSESFSAMTVFSILIFVIWLVCSAVITIFWIDTKRNE